MLTVDKAAIDKATATLAPEQIGRTQYLTPEGFLLCEGARIARTGPMLYTQAEMPEIEPGSGSMITMLRDDDTLFDPECIASFIGKPITNDHPPTPVTPDNAKTYSVGTVLNPRRGEGAEAAYLLGDLLVTDKDAIEAVQAKKRELSPGYDVEVEQIQPGVGRQIKIVGNHVALVDRGRGGPSCSIQDEEPTMAKRTNRILDGIRKAFKAKDEAALEEQLGKAEEMMEDEDGGEGEGSSHHLVIEVKTPAGEKAAGEKAEDDDPPADPNEERFAKLEAAVTAIGEAVAKLKPTEPAAEATDEDAEEKKEEEKEAEKSTAQDAMSKAEILAPGIRLPTMDGAGSLKNAALTSLRRTVLKTAIADAGRKAHVETVLGGRAADFDAMKPSEVKMVFDAASAVARAAHNAGRGRVADIPQGPMTAARLQERILERRKQQRA